MDGLMSEATDLILSCAGDLASTGPNKMLNWESTKNSKGVSSVALLRLSITNSIKDRSTESEIVDIEPSQQKKGRRRKGSSPRKPKVDVQFLNSKEDSLDVRISAFSDEKINPNGDVKEQNEGNKDSESAPFTESIDDAEDFGPSILEAQDTKEIEDGNNVNNNEEIVTDHKAQATRKKIVENGLKLASRKFSDGIFENCSTYSLTCPEVLQERDHHMLSSKEESPAEENQFPAADEPRRSDSAEDSISTSDCQKSGSVFTGSVNDDQVSLSDSFFVNAVNDDCARSVFSKDGSECSVGSRKSSRSSLLSLSKGNDVPNSEIVPRENSGKSERKLSKRLRKRRKKSRSKDAPTYECPKCGVSYMLSPNASDSTARCLHCDFWTSVEPVFLKREKQPWNTCRIC